MKAIKTATLELQNEEIELLKMIASASMEKVNIAIREKRSWEGCGVNELYYIRNFIRKLMDL